MHFLTTVINARPEIHFKSMSLMKTGIGQHRILRVKQKRLSHMVYQRKAHAFA